jgi:hypothetical protein
MINAPLAINKIRDALHPSSSLIIDVQPPRMRGIQERQTSAFNIRIGPLFHRAVTD